MNANTYPSQCEFCLGAPTANEDDGVIEWHYSALSGSTPYCTRCAERIADLKHNAVEPPTPELPHLQVGELDY